MNYTKNNRLRIEKFVYKKGTNVALYNAEKSKRYQAFEKACQKALSGQIAGIADYKTHLPLLMALAKVKSTTAELLSQVSVLINADPFSDRVDLKAYLVWAGTQGGQAALDKLGIDGIFGLKDQKLIDYFGDYSNITAKSIDDYTKQWIAGKIQEGKDEGLTPFQIQQTLIDDGKGITAIRAERIVLTETAKAMGKIELEAAKRNGITEKIWRTSLDERTCPICAPMEGQTVSISSNFAGEQKTQAKTTILNVLYPPVHVSCRCYMEEVIPSGWTVPEEVWKGV